MSTPNKTYMAQYREANRDKLRAQQIERDRKKREAMDANPELRKEYLAKRRQEYLKTHPGAKTMGEYNELRRGAKRPGDRARSQNKTNVIVDGVVMRVCDTCNHAKPLETGFPRHGTHGRKGTCNECVAPANKPKVTKAKNTSGPKFVVSTEKKPTMAPRSGAVLGPKPGPMPKIHWDEKLKAQGWVKLLGETDIVEWMNVYVRNGVILYVRGRLGSYSVANQNYGVMFDDSGKRYPTLGAAEKVAQRMQA